MEPSRTDIEPTEQEISQTELQLIRYFQQLSPIVEPPQIIARIVFNPGVFPSLEEAQKYLEYHFLIADWKKKIAPISVDWLRVDDVDPLGEELPEVDHD